MSGTNPDDRAAIAAGAHTDFSKSMSYQDYLKLDILLSAQQPLSTQHDEMMFIIIHHSTELWMKLMLHELLLARARIAADDLSTALKATARVSRILAQLIQSWDILATMTPSEYVSFRDVLGQSSGFQSLQYRRIEFVLGNKQPHMIAPHRHDPALAAMLEADLAAPSLYDTVLGLLARRGLPLDATVTGSVPDGPHKADPSVLAAWLTIYRDTGKYWDLYELAEELVDLEDQFQQWRFRHLMTVQRIIGFKRGTGGTAGVAYLKRALDIELFPELWQVRTSL